MPNKYGQLCYTYIIGWRELDTWYYGSRRANKKTPKEDLWITYKTSSPHVSEFSSINGEPDVVRIHKLFNDERSAYLHEKKFLKRVDAKRSPRWLNKSINNWDVEKEPRTGWRHTEETKNKISNAMKGKNKGKSHNHSNQTKETLSKIRKEFWSIPANRETASKRATENNQHEYMQTPEARQKQQLTMKKVRLENPNMFKKTDEHKKKISESRLKFLEENGPQLHSAETKLKMSQSAKRTWTPERRAAQAERAKKQHAARKSLIG